MVKEPSDLGRRAAKLREPTKISARELSKAIGASHSVVAHLESGAIQRLQGDFLVSLAKALGTTAEYLLTGKGKAPSKEQTEAAFEAWKKAHARKRKAA